MAAMLAYHACKLCLENQAKYCMLSKFSITAVNWLTWKATNFSPITTKSFFSALNHPELTLDSKNGIYWQGTENVACFLFYLKSS